MKCSRVPARWLRPMLPSAAPRRRRRSSAAGCPPAEADPTSRVDALQPDFDLAALPTTLRMPVHKLAFRVRTGSPATRRGGLRRSRVGLLRLRFGGAQIGLELRYGLRPGTQMGVHRTSDRTIQLFGQHSF